MICGDMIAPCGLNCALCSQALLKENPCKGCLGPDEGKPAYCISGCKIITCKERENMSVSYCDACPRYPCSQMLERETRYANAYPMVESPIGNLAYIRQQGMESFLRREQERWSCSVCGGIICVHTGVCAGCGKKHSINPVRQD